MVAVLVVVVVAGVVVVVAAAAIVVVVVVVPSSRNIYIYFFNIIILTMCLVVQLYLHLYMKTRKPPAHGYYSFYELYSLIGKCDIMIDNLPFFPRSRVRCRCS